MTGRFHQQFRLLFNLKLEIQNPKSAFSLKSGYVSPTSSHKGRCHVERSETSLVYFRLDQPKMTL